MSPSTPHRANVSGAAVDPITELLKTSRTIAVVGLSSNRSRPSYGVAEYLQSVGYRIIPVNPNESEVLGEKSYPGLGAIPEKVEVVDIFGHPDTVAECVESAIRISANPVWIQEGVMHP